MTYAELLDQAARWRLRLVDAGIGQGDRVAILCGNDRRFVASYLGILGIGATAVPLNPLSPSPEIESELRAVGAAAAISTSQLQFEGTQVLVADSVLGPQVQDGAVPPSEFPQIVDCQGNDPAVLLFTSGTAGSPKAAILTHGSLLANLDQIQSHPGRQALSSDVGLAVLPLFHVFGLNVILNLALKSGGSLVMADRPDPLDTLNSIAEYGVTLVAGVPALFDAWTHVGASDAMAGVRMAISGGAPLSRETALGFENKFGIPVWEGYGLTEASPVVTSPVFEGRPISGSVGVPLPGVELRLVDSSGEDALVGDAGEVLVRGPNVFGGYWRDTGSTMRVLDSDGWLHTGDIAVSDVAGNLFLVDRAKDLIIVSGFNVYPQEVEQVISEVEGVTEVAVAGSRNMSGGEAVVAYVVRSAGSKTVDGDITGACRERLAAYKCPTTVFFVDSLPRAASGEVLRRALGPDKVA